MDPLDDLIRLLQPVAVALKTIEGHGRWGLRFARNADVNFGIVLHGSCLLVQDNSVETALQAGDFLLQSGPESYVIKNVRDVAVQDAEALLAKDRRLLRAGDGPGDLTQILAGHFTFDRANRDLLLELLPRCVHIRADSQPAGRISKLLTAIAEEATAQRPGADAMVKRSLEMMLIEVLRDATLHVPEEKRGIIAGLQHPMLRIALAHLHAAPGRDWTVAKLAQAAGTSRTVLTDRFRRTIGVAPMEYLSNWRMALAKDSLRKSDNSMAEIAVQIGYKSASAFSTAFTQCVGRSPRAFRRSES